MKFLTQNADEEPIMPMAPMIDIIFLLLIFFITTSVFARLENELSITVPTAESATTPKRTMGEMIVNLRRDGTIIVNQKEVTLQQLETLLERIAENFPDQSIIIRGDRQSHLEDSIRVLDACANAGVWNVNIAALPPEDAEASP